MKTKKINDLEDKKIDNKTIARISGIRVSSQEYTKPKSLNAPTVHSAVAKRQMVENSRGGSFIEQFNNSEVYAKIYNSRYGDREYRLVVPIFDRSKSLLGIDILKRKPQIQKFSKDQLGETRSIGIPSRVMSSEQKILARHRELYSRNSNEFINKPPSTSGVDLNKVASRLNQDHQEIMRQRAIEFNKRVQMTLNQNIEPEHKVTIEPQNEEMLKAKVHEKMLNIKNKINFSYETEEDDILSRRKKWVEEVLADDEEDIDADLSKRPNL
ncbi:hypothetical protein [Spiroplasma alleghenense]|uniref:Uncharacterized protein n=1 Tax=Spiroplasma alleghenense TaxID=216931 RepID=A0A345Z3A9_9MOLU|nr:hypothetical protein [Spiroplasma alleghenense]AXK51088.1 hypothetical protein SALLE_v1c04140 [Spiroplasma alleghenense]